MTAGSRMTGGAPDGPDGLNALQRAFVRHLTTPGSGGFGCATRAAELAGYTAGNRDSLAAIASRVLRNPNVAPAVRAGYARVWDGAAERRAALVLRASVSMADFVTIDDAGRLVWDFPRAQAAAALGLIRKFRCRERKDDGGRAAVEMVSIEFFDPLDAIRELIEGDARLTRLVDPGAVHVSVTWAPGAAAACA